MQAPSNEPRPADLIIEARWLAPVVPRQQLLERHALVIRDGRIDSIMPAAEARDIACQQRLQLDRHLLLPGLINLHGHAAMSLLRGIANDKPLQRWLEDDIWPAEGRWVDADFVRDGTQLAIGEMIRGGTTCFADMYFFPDVAAAQAHAAGMRAQVAFPVLDFATAWGSGPDEYLDKGLALSDQWKGNERIHVAFGPHAAYTVAADVLERIATLSAEIDAVIHIHLHENAEEVAAYRTRHGLRPLDRLQQIGLLGPRLQAVHMTQLAATDDYALLAEHDTQVIHCPESNLKLASGICPVAALRAAGVNVALGTDGAASNNDLSMPGEMRTAALVGKVAAGDAGALSAHEVLEMATLAGARAMGLDAEIGSLEPGKRADCIAVELDDWNTLPVYDPVAQFVYAAGSDSVTHSWVNGAPLMTDRRLQTLDRDAILSSARAWGAKISTATEQTTR